MPNPTSNKKKARNLRHDAKNAHAPRGKHWCHMHNGGEGAFLPYAAFHKNKAKVHGLHDRCKDCAKAYREAYEAEHGKRTDKTKTLRVSPRVHAMAKEAAKRSGAAVYQYVGAALVFYAAYGCQHPGCTKPKSRYGKCEKHLLSIATTEEDAA